MARVVACCALCALEPACTKREPRHQVERVTVEADAPVAQPPLALDSERLDALFVQRLKAHGSFEVLGSTQASSASNVPIRLTLVISAPREWVDAAGVRRCQVRAALAVRVGGAPNRYELFATAARRAASDALDERQDAARTALDAALSDLIDGAHIQLLALNKPSDALVKDLASSDARVQDDALRVLADRHHPAALEPLVTKLEGDDTEQVRAAIGLLVELNDPRAVPPLIELTRSRDLGFMREILFALGAIGGDEAEAYLYTVASAHEQPAIQEAAERSLDELRGRKKRAQFQAEGGR